VAPAPGRRDVGATVARAVGHLGRVVKWALIVMVCVMVLLVVLVVVATRN
jgi:hypothetical protein